MTNYEVLYALAPDMSDEAREELIGKFKKFVEDAGGNVSGVDKWGVKPLAYPIKFKKEGYYVLMNYSLSKEKSIELGKLMLITENLLRHIIVAK
jgi:small subunit ribosomal protein S6